jgi:chromosome segregation ATPase
MIEKLHKLKKTQTDQKISQQGQIQAKIHTLEEEIGFTQENINTATVDRHGAISDFTILQIHKNTMQMHIVKLEKQKELFVAQLHTIKEEIIELQKETEQYGYMLKEEQKEALRQLLLAEEEAAGEYMQSKYIRG